MGDRQEMGAIYIGKTLDRKAYRWHYSIVECGIIVNFPVQTRLVGKLEPIDPASTVPV
jgi:hypothetical protein